MVIFEPHHLSVRVWAASTASVGKFRLGSSLLGGTDVLGNGAYNDTNGGYDFMEVREHVNEINIENSVNLTGVQDTGGGVSVQIILTSKTDIFKNKFIRIGSPLKIGLLNYGSYTGFTPFFYGILTQLQSSIDPYGTYRYVITASDFREELFSKIIPHYFDDWYSTGLPIEISTRIARIRDTLIDPIKQWRYVEPLSVAPFLPRRYSETLFDIVDIYDSPIGDLITETVTGDGAWMVSQHKPVADFYPDQPTPLTILTKNYLSDVLNDSISANPAYVTLTDNSLDSHTEVAAVNRDFDTTAVINDIKAILSVDGLTSSTYSDPDSIDYYGKHSTEITLNVVGQTELDNYVNWAGLAAGQPKLKGVSIDAIAHKNRHLHEVWKLHPAAPVKVEINQGDFVINERYLVTRVVHRITPNTWETDLELWRNK